MKLLIVDDSASTRALIREFVEPLTSDIAECEDGIEVAATYQRFHPDFVIMDIQMSGLDGIAATLRLRAEEPRAVVLMVSQFDSREARDNARRAGAAHYFLKDDLPAVRNFLAGVRAAASAST